MRESGPPRHTGLRHLPALDGLRGLAVLAVLLFHDDRLTGGYLGVDLFFVLSGYLITSLLLAEHAATGTISLSAFWVRRARRLFPALLALLPAVALYAAVLAEPGELARIRGDGIATIAYVANWRSIFDGRSYWDLFAAPSPLEHTWSLAIEEQFYVVWPLVAAAILWLSSGSRRALFATTAALCAASALAMWMFYSPEDSSRAYLGTDTRGAAILAGASLACVLRRSRNDVATPGAAEASKRGARWLDAAGLVAAVGLAVAWALLDGPSPLLYRGGFWLTELGVLALIACAARDRESLVARALAFRPLAAVGLVSYGLYLWHWPLFVVLTSARVGFGGPLLSAARFGATFAVSIVSYRYLEQPIRKRGLRLPALMVVPAATALAVLAIVVSTAGAETSPQVVATAPREAPPPSATPENALTILVLGDSVAVSLAERLHFVAEGTDAVVVGRGIGDCSILHDQVPTRSLNRRKHDGGDCDAKWVSDVAELHPHVTLVVLGGGFFAPAEIDGRWQGACDRGWRREYERELRRQLVAVGPDGGRVFLAVVPYPVGPWDTTATREKVDCFNETLRRAARSVPEVGLLDLQAALCPHATCTVTFDGTPIRPDGLHFSGAGAEDTSRWLLGRLR
jgi:peptidoglycan/LPS O-acetylase OafA/YrhL